MAKVNMTTEVENGIDTLNLIILLAALCTKVLIIN